MPFVKLKVWSIQGQLLILTIIILFNSMISPSRGVADDDREIKLCRLPASFVWAHFSWLFASKLICKQSAGSVHPASHPYPATDKWYHSPICNWVDYLQPGIFMRTYNWFQIHFPIPPLLPYYLSNAAEVSMDLAEPSPTFTNWYFAHSIKSVQISFWSFW